MLKRFFLCFIIILFIVSIFSGAKAAGLETSLNIIQKASEIKILENNQGTLDKKITSIDNKKGEVDIQLNLKNVVSNGQSEKEKFENTEIYILLSENIVKKEETMTEYINYIEILATKIFEQNQKTKIGIIGIKGTVSDVTYDEKGNAIFGDKDEGGVAGTANDAEIVANLTNNITNIKNNIKNMNTSKTKYRMNLQAAIRLAKKSYSDKVNKILISLYDNVPDIAIGVKSSVSSGGTGGYATTEEAVKAKNQNIVNRTKEDILTLKTNSIDFILLRPDDTSFDQKWYSTTTGKLELDFDGSPYVKALYGTIDNPIYGKMYSLNNENLEKIVTEYIYADIMGKIGNTMKKVVIRDYFPDEILKNFELLISENNKVNTDITKLEIDNLITWNIGDLETGKNATLSYTLKIKDMNNQELLNKTVATNQKVELTYTNYLNKSIVTVLNSSPKIQLAEVKEENENNGMADNTIASGKIPQTGFDTAIMISLGIVTVLILMVIFLKYKSYKDVK